MTQKQVKTRTAMTAIAAVLAISSTPTLAQDASVPDPLVESTPVSTTSDPLAPEPATTSDTAPVDRTATESATDPAPAATKASTIRRSASTTRAPAARARAAAPAGSQPEPAAPVADAPVEAPIAAAPAAPIAEPVPAPAPVAEPAAQDLLADDALPIAGAAGLGLLALAGAGLAMRRRRRRDQEEFADRQWALDHAEADADPAITEPEPVVVAAEPAFARGPAPTHDPIPLDAPVTALPAGFDLSRYGRHVQAAYRGPTPDNPSLSLKNRLRRASFFDQQERREAEERMPAQPASSAKPAWAERKPNEAEFMFRPARSLPIRKPKPAYQG